MTEYRRLRVAWFNSLDCELARVTAHNERDAAVQLIAMIKDAGGALDAGDYFRVIDVGADGGYDDDDR